MWIAPWFTVLLPAAQIMPAAEVLTYVALNMMAALLLVRVLDSRGMWESLRQLVFFVALVLACLWTLGVVFPAMPTETVLETISENVAQIERVSIPPLIPVLVLIGLVWWRGLRLALITPTSIRVAFGMRLGILSLFASALVPQAREATLTALPPFFFFGLLGISFARALSLRELGGQSSSFGARWAGFMVVVAGAITGLGLVIAAFLSGMDPATFAGILQPIISGFVFLVAFLMTPIFLVVGALIEAIMNALQSSGALEELQIPEIAEELGQADPNQQLSQLEQTMRQVLSLFERLGGVQMCLTVIVILVVVALIVLTARRQQRAIQSDPEEREDLDGDALSGLRDMFRWGRDALNSALNTINRFGVGRDLFAALTVRRAYAQMVKVASAEGYPRAVSQTPYEYRDILREAFPAGQEPVEIITEAYVRVHYGEVPESADALRTVTEALQQFKTAADS